MDPEVKGVGVHPSKVVLGGLEATEFPLQPILNHHLERIDRPVLLGDPGADPSEAQVEHREGSEGLQVGWEVLLGDPGEMQVGREVLLGGPGETQVGPGVLLVDQHWEVVPEGRRMPRVEGRQRAGLVIQEVGRVESHPSEGQREGQGQ